MILVELLSYLIVELKETTLETVNINLVSINIIILYTTLFHRLMLDTQQSIKQLMISTNEHATEIL